MLSYTQTKNVPRYKNCLWRFNMIIERKQMTNIGKETRVKL